MAFSQDLAVVVLLLTFALSWWNAWQVGRLWPERFELSGWQRLVMRSTALISFCGFTWALLFVYSAIVYALHDKVSWLVGFGANQLSDGPFGLLNKTISKKVKRSVLPTTKML